MSDGFEAHPEHLGAAAQQAHEHADRVEGHARTLAARTGGRSLGRGPLGAVVEKAVRPIVDSMIGDMSKAMAEGHRSIGHGLEITKKNLEDAEHAAKAGLKLDGLNEAEHAGKTLVGHEGLQSAYQRRIDERVAELAAEGHGPGRHLHATDQMLKDRLGTPTRKRVKVDQPPKVNERGFAIGKSKPKWEMRPGLDGNGYIESENKIDPMHGPGGPHRPEDVRYHDIEPDRESGKPRNHQCEPFSTGFKDNESFVYAEHAARSRIDPNNPGKPVLLTPQEAWGPGDHSGRMRGYYIDPENPVNHDGSMNYKNVDFTGARIKAVYEPDGNGGHRLKTMYPEPSHEHNPPHPSHNRPRTGHGRH